MATWCYSMSNDFSNIIEWTVSQIILKKELDAEERQTGTEVGSSPKILKILIK